MILMPNHALQRTRHERRGCKPCGPVRRVAELEVVDMAVLVNMSANGFSQVFLGFLHK